MKYKFNDKAEALKYLNDNKLSVLCDLDDQLGLYGVLAYPDAPIYNPEHINYVHPMQDPNCPIAEAIWRDQGNSNYCFTSEAKALNYLNENNLTAWCDLPGKTYDQYDECGILAVPNNLRYNIEHINYVHPMKDPNSQFTKVFWTIWHSS